MNQAKYLPLLTSWRHINPCHPSYLLACLEISERLHSLSRKTYFHEKQCPTPPTPPSPPPKSGSSPRSVHWPSTVWSSTAAVVTWDGSKVVSFCIIRVVGGALQHHDLQNHTISTAAQIITNLALTPLLLAAAGILHEARWVFGPKDPRRRWARWLNWFLIIQFHTLVIVGVVLIVSHASALKSMVSASGDHNNAADSSDMTVIKGGFGILVASWVFLCIWTVASYRSRTGSDDRMVELGRNEEPLDLGPVIRKVRSHTQSTVAGRRKNVVG